VKVVLKSMVNRLAAGEASQELLCFEYHYLAEKNA